MPKSPNTIVLNPDALSIRLINAGGVTELSRKAGKPKSWIYSIMSRSKRGLPVNSETASALLRILGLSDIRLLMREHTREQNYAADL